jgi:hypothetical protein
MWLTQKVRMLVRYSIVTYAPEKIITEVVPAIGSQGFMASGQGYIANVVATTIHNVALDSDIPVEQVSARSWESKIAKRKTKKEKVTKPKIRNGVLVHLPGLKQELAKYLNEWDRWDAIAIGLHNLGCITPLE